MSKSFTRAVLSPVNLWLMAFVVLFFANPAMAQSGADFSGGALTDAFCAFQESMLLKVICALLLLCAVGAYMLDLVRDGVAALALKFGIGFLFMFNIPMLMGWFGVEFSC
jgi:hypothetical protein